MTFWTIIWITYTAGPFADISTGLPYPSMAACSAGLVALQGHCLGGRDPVLRCDRDPLLVAHPEAPPVEC